MTTKDDMSEYLERVQQYQRITLGLVNMQISTGSTPSGKAYITVYITPYTTNGEVERTSTGEAECYSCEINEWNEKNINDTSVKTLVWLLKKLNVL